MYRTSAQTLPLALPALAFCLAVFSFSAQAGSKEEKGAVSTNITTLELEAIRAVLDRMADAFKKGDADACMRLFVPRAQRAKTQQNLQREFAQVRYTVFEILSVTPDETIPPRRQSVDVTIRRRMEKIGAALADQAAGDSSDSTIDTFILQRQDDGTFMLLESQFFEKLGQRRGIGLLVNGLLGLMAIFALLVFWVWMGFDAYRARPRTLAWRLIVVFLPLAGALLYFLIRYLPSKIKGKTEGLTEGLTAKD